MKKRPTTHEVQINNNLFALEILLERLVEIKEKFNPEEIKDWSPSEIRDIDAVLYEEIKRLRKIEIEHKESTYKIIELKEIIKLLDSNKYPGLEKDIQKYFLRY